MFIAIVIFAVTFTIAPLLVTALLGVVLPLLVDLVTKSEADKRVKDLALAVLAIVAGVLTEAVTEGGFAIVPLEAFLSAAVAYAVAWVSFRKIGPVKTAADAVQNATPRFGID